jgi:hypothetical protein
LLDFSEENLCLPAFFENVGDGFRKRTEVFGQKRVMPTVFGAGGAADGKKFDRKGAQQPHLQNAYLFVVQKARSIAGGVRAIE